MLKLRRQGLDIAPPYDDPLLMTYLLFPNRGKYELADVVFDFMGHTVNPEDERTPWIGRLFNELAPRVRQEVARPYDEIELPLSPVLVEMERARRIGYDIFVKEPAPGESGDTVLEYVRSTNIHHPTYRLTYGKSLIEFAPELTTAKPAPISGGDHS